MTTYKIDPVIFERFPGFRRGVLIATGVDNAAVDRGQGALLAEAVARVGATPSFEETARIEAWNDNFRAMSVDPGKFTPSIRFLHDQIRRGKPPRLINVIVDLFNLTSLRWTAPCGGDDLDAIGSGDLLLGLAQGDETFTPLFKPVTEHPVAGEVIYFTPQTRRVMCRRWTWRNADFSRIKSETSAVAINIDIVTPPFGPADAESALDDFAGLVRQFCGGTISLHVLSSRNPSFIFHRR